MDQSRQAILARFRAKIAAGEPIIGGGAGTGLSAVSEEAGGIDLLVVYNSGRYRMAGRGSSAGLLAYGNANQIVKEMAYEILPVVKKTPVLAGVNGTDPFIIPRLLLEELRTLGFAGIQNFPTVGLFDGDMRTAFEETGMSYQLEVDVVRLAHELDLLTTPYVFNTSEAERMADAGADLIVAHMGVTTGGSIGAKSAKSLDDCVAAIQRIADAARGVNPDAIVICHGGPISEPPDAAYVIARCRGLDGFYGASSVERLPAERAIADQIRTFKQIRLREAPSRNGVVVRKTTRRFVTPAQARVHYAPWGKHVWLSEPALTDTTSLTLIRVSMPRGTGHQFHVHPELDEIIYVVDGVAEQWVDRDRRRLRKGEIAYIPKGVVHATYNSTKRPLTFLAILSPAASKGPVVIDCSNEEPWRTLRPPIVYRDVDPRTGRSPSRQAKTQPLNSRTRK